MGQLLRLDETLDRLVERDTRRRENGKDDCEARDLLGAEATEEERDSERDGGERVAEVVNEVGEERDGAGERKYGELRECRSPEESEADRDCLDTFARPNDRAIDEPVRVSVAVTIVRPGPVLVMAMRTDVGR